MKFEEYVPLAMVTLPKGRSRKDNLLNACLGLAGEYSEYVDETDRDKKIEELGDIHWYIALLSHANSPMGQTRTPEKVSLLKAIGEVCDDIKKHIFQGHNLSKKKLDRLIIALLVATKEESKKLGVPQEKVMQMNIDKLKKRYPKGFEVKRSINRRA